MLFVGLLASTVDQPPNPPERHGQRKCHWSFRRPGFRVLPEPHARPVAVLRDRLLGSRQRPFAPSGSSRCFNRPSPVSQSVSARRTASRANVFWGSGWVAIHASIADATSGDTCAETVRPLEGGGAFRLIALTLGRRSFVIGCVQVLGRHPASLHGLHLHTRLVAVRELDAGGFEGALELARGFATAAQQAIRRF